MKKLFLLLSLIFTTNIFAGTCTSISRSNNGSGTVLTASKYNTDINTAYTAINAFDGGCITDGTLEFAALNSSDFASVFNAIQQGCKVSYSDTNTISVGKCIAAVNGYNIRTTSSNTAAWGCSGCSSEVSSTQYYVYIKTGSTGTTLNLLISTTAPNEDGYDNSSNKVLARFYNNSASDIDQYSIDQWVINKFIPQNATNVFYTPTFVGLGTVGPASNNCSYSRRGALMFGDCYLTFGATTATVASMSLPSGLAIDSSKLQLNNTTANIGQKVGDAVNRNSGSGAYSSILTATGTSTTLLYFSNMLGASAYLTPANGSVFTNGEPISYTFRIPIAGWLD